MDAITKSDRLVNEIKQRAWLFALDNLIAPTERDRLMIENAMLIGASIASELELEDHAQ
jgi:hypothetical protein